MQYASQNKHTRTCVYTCSHRQTHTRLGDKRLGSFVSIDDSEDNNLFMFHYTRLVLFSFKRFTEF